MSRTDVLGVGFDNVTKAEAVERALELIDAREGRYVVTPNPEIVMLARRIRRSKRRSRGRTSSCPTARA